MAQIVAILVKERTKRGISQNLLAQMAGLSQSGLRYIEVGKAQPTLLSLLRMAHAMNVELGAIISEVERR